MHINCIGNHIYMFFIIFYRNLIPVNCFSFFIFIPMDIASLYGLLTHKNITYVNTLNESYLQKSTIISTYLLIYASENNT